MDTENSTANTAGRASIAVTVGARSSVGTHVYGTRAPILHLYSGGAYLTVVTDDLPGEEQEAFARALVAAAQRFLDATVEYNARQAVPA